MKNLLLLAAFCLAGSAQAAVLTFDDPGVVEIDNGIATYTEAGFAISGLAASFLPIDQRLVGGFDATPFSLMLAGGGNFSLRSLDHDFFELGFGGAGSELTITGLRGGIEVASLTVDLGGPDSPVFGADWARLGEVRFSGAAGFSLDNIDALAVPEPGSLALGSLALLGLGLRRRQANPRV